VTGTAVLFVTVWWTIMTSASICKRSPLDADTAVATLNEVSLAPIAALSKIVLDAPNGKITLDENRQAIGTNFVTEVIKDDKGELISKVVKVIPNVQQRLGFSKAVFDKLIPPGRENPPCKKSYE